MPDGTVFDAEYYAKTYPDVVSAIGTDENALYQHYVMAGKAEGRHPVAPVQTTESKPSASSSNLDNTLASIQNKLSTGTVATIMDEINLGHVNKFNADEDIDSYVEPILELMARNGYRYVLCYNNTLGCMPFNGKCHARNLELFKERSIYVSNTNHRRNDKTYGDVIKITINKTNQSYRNSLYSYKKNDILVTMRYPGPFSETGYTIVHEIPVN